MNIPYLLEEGNIESIRDNLFFIIPNYKVTTQNMKKIDLKLLNSHTNKSIDNFGIR